MQALINLNITYLLGIYRHYGLLLFMNLLAGYTISLMAFLRTEPQHLSPSQSYGNGSANPIFGKLLTLNLNFYDLKIYEYF